VEIHLDTGEHITCTFTNEHQIGNITIAKEAPGGGATQFHFGGDMGLFGLTDGTTGTQYGIPAGDYTVTETMPLPSPWALTDVTCVGGDSDPYSDAYGEGVTIHLETGEHITCTFTNTQVGTIVVEKQTDPDGASDSFSFSGDAAGTISDGGQIVVGDLLPGTYTSQETEPFGWDLTSIVCDDTNSSGVGNTATFQLDPGETVKCTFNNWLREASIGGWIWDDANFDGIQDPGERGIAGVTVILYDCFEELLDTTTSGADGMYAFDGVIAGDYILAFVPPLGHVFAPQDQGSDDEVDSEPDRITGETDCFAFDAREDMMGWDVGLFELPQPPPEQPDQPEPPPVVPEASTLLLLGSAAASLVGYAGAQWRARRRK
jgi:hypothetical protein